MTEITRRFGRLLARHAQGRLLEEHGTTRADRQLVSSEATWEPLVGYGERSASGSGSRSLTRRPLPKGAVRSAAPTSAPRRARSCDASTFVLRQADAALEPVVRTRMYVTDINRWEEVGRVHGEVFGSIRPATSMMEVHELHDPALLVEIEADALLP